MRDPLWLVALAAAACGGSSSHSQQPASQAAAAPAAAASDAAAASVQAPASAATPMAPPRPVTNTYHGVAVVDPYQWLEGDTDEVKAWSAGQNQAARKILDGLAGLDTLRDEIRAIIAAPITRYGGFESAGGKVFALRKQPTKEQPELVVMDSPEAAATARLVLDPTVGRDSHASMDWFVPSPDGTKIAVSISEGGSESGTLHVLDLAGKDIDTPIPNVQRGTGGGDVAWRADGKAFWYTRYPAAGEKPDAERDFWMQVWFHELGKPQDTYELGKELPRIAEIQLDSDKRGRVIATVQNGDGGIFRHYLRDTKGAWRQLTDWDDKVTTVSFGPTADLWLVSTNGAPRGKLLRLPANATKLAQAKQVIAEGADAIVASFGGNDSPVVTPDRIYVTYQLGGTNAIRSFTLAGKPVGGVPLPDVSSSYLYRFPIGKDLMITTSTYVSSAIRYRYNVRTNKLAPIAALSPTAPVSLDDFEVHREMATSKDGTKVPLNIVWRKGAMKDGSTPCLVTGYGGYGISRTPRFLDSWYPVLRRGVCVVEVNLRGGGEFGEAWHQAGALTNKQNVFDDFSAALAHLHQAHYTRPDRTVIIGGSNGGLLMGAQLTQHPEQVKAVVSQVGIYDMLRVELSPNGLYNTTEFGTVTDEAQFKALYAYSPYHHVKQGTKYPPVLMTTGANDPRVSPWHSRKMVAALQAAQPGGTILLRTSSTSGHGIGTAMSERIDTLADVTAFILWQLGISVGG